MTFEVGQKIIEEFENDGKVLQADGIRVVLAHLNPNGYDEGINFERDIIISNLISQNEYWGRLEQAEGMKIFKSKLKSVKGGDDDGEAN